MNVGQCYSQRITIISAINNYICAMLIFFWAKYDANNHIGLTDRKIYFKKNFEINIYCMYFFLSKYYLLLQYFITVLNKTSITQYVVIK